MLKTQYTYRSSKKKVESKEELIELFLNDKRNALFQEKFEEFLGALPRARVTKECKKEFFISAFLGASFVFLNTELANTIGVKSLYFRVLPSVAGKNNGKNNIALELLFKVEREQEKQIIFRTITFDISENINSGSYSYSDDDIREIATSIRGLEDLNSYKISYKLLRISENTHKEQQDILTAKWVNQNPNLKIKAKAIQQRKKFPFEEVSTERFENHHSFENLLDNLSTDEIKLVKDNAKEVFKKLIDIYKRNLGKSKNFTSIKPEEAETEHHGFIYGALVFNFKRRYQMDSYIEIFLGKGTIDLLLILRKGKEGSSINWESTPILAELKAGDGTEKDPKTAASAIKQIKDQGYLRFPPSVRTVAENGVILGVNFNKEREEDALLSEQVKISPMQSFILELLNNDQEENIKDCLKSQLESLPYLIPIESASGKPFSRLVLGQMLSTEGIDKRLFVYSDKDVNSKVSTFLLKKEDKEFWLMLNIIENTEGIDINTKTIKLDEGYKNCIQVTIEKNNNKHGVYYKVKEIKKDSISTLKENWDGELKEVGQINLLQQEEDGSLLIKEEDDLKVNLNEALSLLKGLGEDEIKKGFYEVMQGLFIGNKYASEENNKLRVFRKVTVSRWGAIDLAMSILRNYEGAYKENELVIVTLDKQSEDKLFQQLNIEKYLKSISYLGEGRSLSITLNSNNIENISVENINDGKFRIEHDDTDDEYYENLKNELELFLDLIQNGSTEELKTLLNEKQKINRDEKLRILRANNYVPFLLAIERGDSKILELLLEYACNIDNEGFVEEILKSKDEYDNTLLHLALEQQNESIIKQLIEQCKSYDVLYEILESQNDDGDTLLHISIKKGNEEIYKLLMDEYNDYKILEKMLICENDDSETPLGYAIDNEDFNFFQELKYTYYNIEELYKENEDLREFIFAKTTPSYSWRASDMEWHALFAEYNRDDGSDVVDEEEQLQSNFQVYDRKEQSRHRESEEQDDGSDKSDSCVVDEEEQLQSNFQVYDREEQSRHRESEEQEEVCSNVSEPSVSSTSSPYERQK